MQITIYLPDELIQKVDSLAKKQRRSRSSLIQETLSRGLEAGKSAAYPVETVSAFGAWKDLTVEQIDEFRRSFTKDIRRPKLK